MRKFLSVPDLYHAYQKLGGFYDARRVALSEYIDFSGVKRVFDIGCGPGHTVQYLPAHLDYTGFDTDARYIDYANRRFGDRGKFVVRLFDESAAKDFGPPDLIMMNGVLHHMTDAQVRDVAAAAAAVLPKHGVFFCAEPCFEDNQNPISRFLQNNDRGEYIRTAPAYEKLVATAFSTVKISVRNDLSWVPYTFAFIRASQTP
jgi:SAM-dependent methyltransferase